MLMIIPRRRFIVWRTMFYRINHMENITKTKSTQDYCTNTAVFFSYSLLAKNQETENDNNNTMRGLVLRDLSGMLKFKRISIQLCVFLLSGFNLVSGNIFLEKCISIAVVLNTFTKWFCKYSNYHETPS